MNRHERRRRKKNNKTNQFVNPILIEGIKYHTDKNYRRCDKALGHPESRLGKV